MTLSNTEYYIFSNHNDGYVDRFCDDDKDAFDGEFDTTEKVMLNPQHYIKGYFFWNDMDDYEDKDEHFPMCFNSLEHLDWYMNSNDGGGHFQCTIIEEWKNGEMIKHVQVSDEEGCTEEYYQYCESWSTEHS